jgi:hypothetical protein
MKASRSAVLGAIWNFFAVVLIGGSLGWLTGLSSSSLLSVAMPVLLTLITGALAAVRLIGKPAADAPPMVSVYTIAIFAIGLGAGASLGTMARLGDWLSPDPEQVIERWNRWRDVVPHDEVVRRVFERALPDPYRAARPPTPAQGQ